MVRRVAARMGIIVGVVAIAKAGAGADASVPAAATVEVAGSDAYRPSEPLPPGFHALRAAVCEGGVPGLMDPDGPNGSDARASGGSGGGVARCERREEGVVGFWRRHGWEHEAPAAVRVRIVAAPPATGRGASLDTWARALWVMEHGSARGYARARRESGLRAWATPDGRAVEWGVSGFCRECDPIYRMTRFQERGGRLIHVDVAVFGVPRAEEVAALKRAFVDGPLGARP